MADRPYPWVVGTYEAGTRNNPVLLKLQSLARKRWGFRNLGTYVVRNMNSHPVLSTHAIPAAADQGYGNTAEERKKAIQACLPPCSVHPRHSCSCRPGLRQHRRGTQKGYSGLHLVCRIRQGIGRGLHP